MSDPRNANTEASLYDKLGVIYHHFSHILVVTYTNPDTVWESTTEGSKYQETGIIGD